MAAIGRARVDTSASADGRCGTMLALNQRGMVG
jgi:hypothetical protein